MADYDALRHYPEPVAPLTRAEVEAQITQARIDMQRAPKVMAERWHSKIDGLLEQWRAAALEESLNEET